MKSIKSLYPLAITFALFAVFAPSAAATDYFQAGAYPAAITGSATEAQTFGMEGLSVKCNGASLEGALSEPAESIEVSAAYSECIGAGIAATVSMEGCKYRLYANTSNVDLVCPSEKTVKIIAVTGNCEVQVSAQTGVAKAEYSASGENLSLKFNLSGVKYKKAKDGFLCPLSGTGEATNGTLSGTVLLKGWKAGVEVGMQRKAAAATKLCKEDKNPCPAGQEHKTNTVLKGSSANVEFILSGTEVIACELSEISGKTKEDAGNHRLQTTWDNAVFGTCVWTGPQGKGNACTITLTPGATVDILAIGGKNGDWRLGDSQLLLACDVTLYKACLYKATGAKLELRGDKEGKATAVADRLFEFVSSTEKPNQSCFKQTTWKGTYELSTPTEFYVTN
jgi:hypothetical protein